jgi:hypothetical protein
MGGTCSAKGERRGVYRILVGKPEGKRQLGKPRHSWEDYIKMDLQEVGCEVTEERRGVYRVLVGKPEGKRQLGKPRHTWEDYIKMDLQEVGCEVTDWIELAQIRDGWRALVSAVTNLRVS